MAEVARPALDDEKERRLPPGAAGLEHREQLENTKRMINEKLQAYGVKVRGRAATSALCARRVELTREWRAGIQHHHHQRASARRVRQGDGAGDDLPVQERLRAD